MTSLKIKNGPIFEGDKILKVVAFENWTIFNCSNSGTYRPNFEKVIRFFERRKNSVLEMYQCFLAIFKFSYENTGWYITNFEIFMNFISEIWKNSKLGILGPHFQLENLKMARKRWYISKTELFALSKNRITFSKYCP